jgi:ligand-binding SRPBCC domain-containing protein
MPSFVRSVTVPAPASELFAWHLRDGAFEDLVPPWDGTRVAERSGRIEDDTMRVVLSVPVLGPIRQGWTVRHEGYEPGRRFCDVMERGPFRSWHHEHLVEPVDEHSSTLTDSIRYELPLGRLGEVAGGWLVRRRLERMFDYRHRVTREAFER